MQPIKGKVHSAQSTVDVEPNSERKEEEFPPTERGSIIELRQQNLSAKSTSADQREMEEALAKFPTIRESQRQKTKNRQASIFTSAKIMDDPNATIRATTRAQAKLGYTQTSATLTWQNISCDNDSSIRLFPVCGYIKPGQMMCVLGGGDDSGIPDLFRILKNPQRIYSGKDKGMFTCHGDILLNGLPPGKFYKRTVSFIPKTDNHLPTLKVGETLLFSAKMRSPAHIREAHLEKSVDTVLEWMGLTEDHKNTFVGDANLKGISGGQKRRLSIGVEVVSGFSICIAELPTNGLDAKTAFEVVNCAKKVATAGDKSMIMSLAQPSPELFDLFDNCCLLAMGECIYFGPQCEVKAYLQNECNLIQPENKSLPAWIEELTVKPTKFMSATLRNEMSLSGRGSVILTDRQVIRHLAKKFRNSKHFSDLSKEVLWRHLDLINADTKCKQIPEAYEPNNNQDAPKVPKQKSREEVEDEEKASELTESEMMTATGYDGEKDVNQEKVNEDESHQTMDTMKSMTGTLSNTLSTTMGTSGSGSGFGSLASELHRRTTDKIPVSTDTMEAERQESNGSIPEVTELDGSLMNYEKTYDLRGLEWGFLWKLPRLPSPMYQIKELCKRQFLATSRNKALIFSRLLQAFIASICLGALFFNIGYYDDKGSNGSDATMNAKISEGMRSRVGVLFFIVGFMGFGAVPFIPALSTQLPVFYYQKQSGYFKVYCFYLAQVIAEIPFTFIESCIFSMIAYPMIGLYPSFQCFSAFFFITFLVRLTSWSFCMAVTGAVGNASVAQSIATLILPIWYAFNGYLVPTKQFPEMVHLKFVALSSFFTYPFQYLVRSELGSVRDEFQPKPGVTSRFATMWLDNYGIDPTPLLPMDLVTVILVTLMWFTIFNIVAYICLSHIDYSVISYKKSMQSMNQKIDSFFGVIADVFCCGLGRKGRHNRKKEYVRKQIEQYRQRESEDVHNLAIDVMDGDGGNQETTTDDSQVTPDVYLEFKDIKYTVPIKNQVTGKVEDRVLLNNNSGYVRPGEVVALMGPSGAGKSTLLDVLANKKNTGTIEGTILLNGKKPDSYYNRCFGYVEQFDSHMTCLTVYEAIAFSAKLRLPADTSSAQRHKMVHKVMKQLELTPLSNRRIGGAGESDSISQEARKKVTIAVELVSNPGLLFLDEPTTGLDGGAAYAVMKTVRKLADEEKCAVICTIHQPSAEVFGLFDKILLLQAGGKMVYFDSIDKLQGYYERNGFGSMESGRNPADFAIEAIEVAQHGARSPNDIWEESDEWKQITRDLNEEKICPLDVQPITFNSEYATSFFTQLTSLIGRSWKFFTRDSIGLVVRLSTGAIMGLMLGILYWDIQSWSDDKVDMTSAGAELRRDRFTKNMFLSILYVTVVWASESCAQEIPLLVYERPMFYRQIDSKFYSVTPYYIARVLAQFPLILLQTVLFVAFIYPMAYHNGINGDDTLGTKLQGMALYFLGVLAMLMTATTFSQMLAICTPNEGVGNVLYTTICTLCRMFGGFLIKISVMAGPSQWVNAFNFFKYALFYFAGTQLTQWKKVNTAEIKVANGEKIFEQFRMDQQLVPPGEDNPWVYFGGLVTFLMVFHIIGLVTLRLKRWAKR